MKIWLYSVWVGGAEVNDFMLDRKTAKEIAEFWRNDGYDDVFIERTSRWRYKKMMSNLTSGE